MMNKKHSFRDYTNKDLSGLDPDEFSNTTIRGTCFSQEIAGFDMLDIFPPGVKNVTFEMCNLDNVKLPTGSKLGTKTTNRFFKIQSDGFDWLIDAISKKPKEPLNKNIHINMGHDADPAKLRGRSS